MCSRLSQRVVNEPSTRAASGMMRCKQWWQQSGVYSVADWSVNRCLESDGITACDQPGLTAHPPPSSKADAGSRGYLSIAGRKDADPLIQRRRHTLSLSASALSTRASRLTLSPETFSPQTRLTLPLTLYPLRVCWCWVACYAPLAVYTTNPSHSTFRPRPI
jgi:hypothetical protein